MFSSAIFYFFRQFFWGLFCCFDIHYSYAKTRFEERNSWYNFISTYLKSRQFIMQQTRTLLALFLCCLTCTSTYTKTTLSPFSNSYRAQERVPEKEQQQNLTETTKDWNFYVYFAGRNNLWRYVDLNLSQMEEVGSNERINLIGMVDQFLPDDHSEIPDIRYVEVHKKQTVTVWNSKDVSTAERMKNPLAYASGHKDNLKQFLEWAIKTYPAKKHCLVFWNHGNGAKDPLLKSARFAAGLDNALFNQDSKGFSFNKNPDLFDALGQKKGVCFNDAYDVYLSNQDLTEVLGDVCKNTLKKQFDIIGMDACYMAQLEVASQLDECCEFLVASEEYELGAGWNYERFLKHVAQKDLSAQELAARIVEAYKDEYASVGEHTLSALNLSLHPTEQDPQPKRGSRSKTTLFRVLEQQLDAIGSIMIDTLSGSGGKDAIKVLKTVRTKRDYHTSFCDDNLDLYHFLFSLEAAVPRMFPGDKNREARRTFTKEVSEAMYVLNKIIPYHTAGNTYKGHRVLATKARGLSLYVPKRTIHHSYPNTAFAKRSSWYKFVELFLRKKRAVAE